MREVRYRQIICELLSQFYHLGWTTGTGGGMAIKNKATGNIIMSPSAIQKERLKPHNLFILDTNYNIIDSGFVNKSDNVGLLSNKLKLTACFTLFKSCFDNNIHPETGCVIHSHSKNVAIVSLMFDNYVQISGLEMIKGITGHSNIENCIIPIINNTPKEPQLTKRLQQALKKYPKSYGVIVRGHGIYVFGKDWPKAKQHAECYDYLFQTIIEMKKLNIAEKMLYKTQFLTKFPVQLSDEVQDTIDYQQHPHYKLFLVSHHPFINNKNNNNTCKIAMIRSLIWQNDNNCVVMLNQKIIPQKFGTVKCVNYQQISENIKIMTIRGAPAIGAAAAYGMALAALQFYNENINNSVATATQFINFMKNAKETLDASRPTAVNLVWATNRMQNTLDQCINISMSNQNRNWLKDLSEILLAEAHNICNEDMNVCTRLGENGAKLIKKGYGVMHHCNTGSLATVCGGTALAAITKAFYENKNITVYVNETRPRLQGSRLTSWELSRMNIAHKVVVDSACAHLISNNKINCIIVGCDRVAINGDVANKIGTQTVATVAYQYNIPFYISCPVSTIDENCKHGDDIIIEQRNQNEIKQIGGIDVANPNADCYNPAFDVTPNKFITAFITEYGICYPPFEESLSNVVRKQKVEVNAQRNRTLKKYIDKMTNNITAKL